MTVVKLTDDQRQLVEDNHKLIPWYIGRAGLEYAEWYDLLAIEMCYASQKYDPTKGSFTSYFKMRADGLVAREFQKTMSQKRRHTETEFVDALYDPEHSTFDTLLYAPEIFFDDKIFEDSEYGNIARLRYGGYTQSEIAKLLGVSQSYVSNVLKKLRKKYYEDDR